MKDRINVLQKRDTRIRVIPNHAFATVLFQFEDVHGNDATVTLDMESAITVLAFMDNGPEAIGEIKASKRPWWRFW